MADNRTFTLIGKFDDQISKKLKEINKVFSEIRKSTEGFSSDVGKASKSISKMTSSLEDAGRAAGKVRDTVSQIGEGVKGLDGIGESLEAAARAAGRAQDEVLGIGEAAGRANRQADDLMTTLLKAEGLSKFGDAMAQGFGRGMNVVMGTIRKSAGLAAKLFTDAANDELADIKAAQGIEGSFGLAGFKGDFKESQRMYKKYDQVVSEMIRQSSAPTSKVVELQRYTLDTIGPLMLAAQGVKKGTAMKDIDPKKIQASAKQYGAFLEKAALFSQGTGSNTIRVAAGLEQLVTRGKIDTTIDFFSDNVMLMKNLEAVGFAGRGARTSKMMNATDAQRMAAMMEAFNKSMSGESTKAMAMSLTGSLQGLQDTIFNPSVGILGMSVTFSKEEQKKANEAIRRIQNERISAYKQELNSVKTSEERKKQLRINIEQAEKTRDQLIKEDEISTPFKAFSYAFANIVRKLTEAINAIGPVWTNFAVAAIDVTNKVFGPLGETLGNVASDMRAKKVTQAEGFGRIVGEIFKTIGQIMGDLANMINDPSSAMGKVQSEFMKGFMAAFKDPGTLRAAQEGIKNGLSALIGKFFEFLWKAITFEPFRPLMLLFVAGIFGPPLIGAVIAGATPLIISAIGKMVVGALGKGAGTRAAGGGGFIARQFQKSASLVGPLPGVKPLPSPGAAAKGWWQTAYTKPIGPAQAGSYEAMRGPGFMASKLTGAAKTQGALSGIVKIGQKIPGLSLALAGLDFTMRKAAGQKTSVAAGGAAGNLVGGIAGAALGSALGPAGTVVGGIAGSMIGSWIGENIVPAIQAIPGLLSTAWTGFKNWITNLPANFLYSVGATIANLQKAWSNFKTWWEQSFTRNVSLWVNIIQTRIGIFARDAAKFISNPSEWGKLATAILDAVTKMFANVRNGISNWWKGVQGWFSNAQNQLETGYRETQVGYLSTATRERQSQSSLNIFDASNWKNAPKKGKDQGGRPNWSGSLGDAISQELRMKPSGSDLVIANSSETIIPAAGGNAGGMVALVDAFRNGLAAVANTVRVVGEMTRNTTAQSMTSLRLAYNQASQAQQNNLNKINQTLIVNQQQTNTRLAKLETKFSAPGMGSLGGGGVAGVDAFSPMARSYGLTMTSGFRPGDPGWHGVNRARDYSNGTGPTPQMMAFARFLASNYGRNLKELIYTPLGFGIKNGQKVAPYARAAHYNHVHVAYALGAGMPAFFSSQTAARNWERKATLGNVKVSSITANSGEGFGGCVTVNAPITIHQQPGQNSEHLAALVAAELSAAIRQARSSTMYV